MFHFHRTPNLLKWLFPKLTWEVKTDEKVIFLTFDDGPIPEVTEFVLAELTKFNAKATFFCVGENIKKHPHIFEKVVEGKHSIGNRTYNHIKGWQTADNEYFENIKKCDSEILFRLDKVALFRPPYGRIKKTQAKELLKKYQIIMWDVLTCDYDKKLDPEKCLQNSLKATQNGSIVVFHDSLKARKNMEYVLPKYLTHFSKLGFRFDAL